MASFVPAEGAVLAQKFALVRPLASGGMGTVWVAEHLELQVEVAIKFMESAEALPNARARFEREARAAAKLRSPHVVQVLDYGVDGDTPYLVMEMLSGEDLRARLDRSGHMSLREVSHIVAQVAKGLELAHEAGFVHRDIKPSNVFLAKVGSDEIAKILDFGVAKAHRPDGSGEQTTSSQLLGSPAYMSPEQARGGDVTHLSDLWSLGVVAYVALAGEHPFTGDNVGDLLVRICTDDLVPVTAHRPDLPPAVDAFFARALCRSPDGRFASATALAGALAAVADARDTAGPGVVGPRDEATVDASAGAIRRLSDGDSLDPTGVTAVAPAPRSRAWIFAVLGAAAVAGMWLLSRTLGADPEPSAAVAPSQPAPPAVSAAPVTTTAPSAIPSASVTTHEKTAPPPPRTWTPRPPPPTTTTTAPPAIDPKFGLPRP